VGAKAWRMEMWGQIPHPPEAYWCLWAESPTLCDFNNFSKKIRHILVNNFCLKMHIDFQFGMGVNLLSALQGPWS